MSIFFYNNHLSVLLLLLVNFLGISQILAQVKIVEVKPLHPEYIVVHNMLEETPIMEIKVANLTGADITNLRLISVLFKYTSPVNADDIKTFTSIPIALLAAGDTITMNQELGSYKIEKAGRYSVTHRVAYGPGNNETFQIQTPYYDVSERIMSRDLPDGFPQGHYGLDFPANSNLILGQTYEFKQNLELTGIEISTFEQFAGRQIQGVLFACDDIGKPTGTAIAETLTATSNGDGTAIETFPLRFSSPVNLTAGQYFMAIKQRSSDSGRVLGQYSIFTPGKAWMRYNGNPAGDDVWIDPSTHDPNLSSVYGIRPMIGFVECNIADLATTGSIGICGTQTFHFDFDIDPIPPGSLINAGFIIRPLPGASGASYPNSLTVANYSTTNFFNRNLGNILPNNNLPPLYGPWVFTGFFFNGTDISNSICWETESSLTVTFGTEVIVSANISNATNNDGAINLSVTQGFPPYIFSWSNGATTEDVSDLMPGDYSVTVEDASGCKTVETYTVELSSGISNINGLNEFKIFPNPTSGQVQVAISLSEKKETQLFLYDFKGSLLRSYLSENIQKKEYSLNLDRLPDGLYLLKLDVAGQSVFEKISIVK